MDITSKNTRATLKGYFVRNAIPTQGNFEDLIDSLINQADDGIVKLPGKPLSLQPDVSDTELNTVLNFYKNLAEAEPSWTLSLNPRTDIGDAKTAQYGWSLGDKDGMSRLFIDETTGNVGIGTIDPAGYKLSVNGSALFTGNYLYVNSENAGRLRVGAAWGMPGLYSGDDGKNPLILGVPTGQKVYMGVNDQDAFVEGGTGNAYFKGNVGIGTVDPKVKLEVKGGFKAEYNASGERPILLEEPKSGNHRGYGEQAATGLVYRVEENPEAGEPIFQVTSSGHAVRFFVEHDGWTGSQHNSAWFGGTAINYFAGNVGIGTVDPKVKLEVNGDLKATKFIGDGSDLTSINTSQLTGSFEKLEVNGAAIISSGDRSNMRKHMSAGSLTLGSINKDYGGGNQWSENTAGLLLETLNNTEIAVHDAGKRVASLMYYVGDASNRITIGRDMGWGAIKEVVLNGNVGIGTTSPRAKLDINQNRTNPSGHPNTIEGLYVTGDFGEDANGVEFRHSNGTQGIGFGYNTIYATGRNGSQDLNLKARNDGTVTVRGNGKLIRKISMATGRGNDGKDNGYVVSRTLTIIKAKTDTALRILYCDNFRVTGTNVAARWEIHIDGKSTSNGGIYQDIHSSNGNRHAPATIMGYATGISVGTHTIQIWVGKNVSHPQADAFTGWNESTWTIEAEEVLI
jgi:hypothetical protein